MNTTDDKLWDLLATWEEQYRQGQDVPAEELCRDCPDLIEEVAASITSLKRMDWLLKPMKDDDPTPTRLPFDFGEYTVIEKIGTGGMGQVFKALHRRMDRTVALKILPEGSVKSADALARFQQEVRSAAKLIHPNIVTAYDAGEPLLDELAKAFIARDYDLKYLFEAIVGSKAYQLSSRGSGPAPLFSRQPLRGLTGEQLYDSLAAATGQSDFEGDDSFAAFRGRGGRGEFLTKFGQQNGKATDQETSIIQALTLMNGSFVSEATTPTRSELLSAVLEAPFFTEKGRIETIYLASLSRLPTAKELEKAESFVGRATTGDGKNKAKEEALADIFWALINSAEFVFNH